MDRDRLLLAIASAGYVVMYLFVVFVAFVTSGPALFDAAPAWYAALMPPAYALVCVAWSFGRLSLPRRAVVILHALALPALALSFLGLGLLLPVLALLWWRAAGRPRL